MAHGKKDGFGYLDGVPIKIHDKCIASRKVTLPISFQYCPSSSLVNAQYDFTLENEVLKWTESYEEKLTALESAKVEKVASDIEEFTKIVTASDDQCSVLSLASEKSLAVNKHSEEETVNNSVKVANSSYVPGWQHNSILQPQQVSCQSASNCPESVRRKNFNISDFESESSSPFDYMELQTINDLEELNNVFQDMSVVKSSFNQSTNKIEQNAMRGTPSASHSNYECNNTAQPDCRTTIKRTRSHPAVDSIDIQYRNGYEKSSNSENIEVTNNISLSNRMVHRFSDYPNSTIYPPTATDLSSYIPNENDESIPQNLSLAKGSHIVACPLPTGIRNCKSISDLSKLKGTTTTFPKSLDLWRPNTPPPWPQDSSDKDTKHALPDPYDELTTEHQKIVLTIEEMGFPRGQVARAVRHLGDDSKRIIEHLCQVQKLIETGHNDIDAEVALHINEYKMEEATKFLDLTEQLKSLGFEKNAIARALVQHKNDRDKALDALLS